MPQGSGTVITKQKESFSHNHGKDIEKAIISTTIGTKVNSGPDGKNYQEYVFSYLIFV